MSTHRTKTWFTAGELVCRIGEDTYRIKVGPGQFRGRHKSQIRASGPDLAGKHGSPDYTNLGGDSDADYAAQEDYTIEKILVQHASTSAPG